jgi:hypothetical protein
MTEMVRFDVRAGQSVVAEVDGPGDWTGAGAEGSAPVGRRNRHGDLGQIFDSSLGQVRDAAEAALAILREASSPDEIKLSLGIKLTQEAGAIIARTALEGNLAVELVWKRTAA